VTPATLAAELHTLLPADARALVVPKPFRVRVARSRESRRGVVMRALPYGAQRAASQLEWLNAVRSSSQLAHLRVDSRATLLEVAKLLAWTASWDTMTTRPTWEHLVERSGRSRATVARQLGRLRAAGLLGVVATGRSAQYATGKGDGAAEAAVYVLAVPSALAPVDEHETPTVPRPPGGTHPPHARASEGSSEPLRGASDASPAAPSAPRQAVAGSDPRPADAAQVVDESARRLAERSAAELRLDERLAPARALQSRLPVLRRISDRHVASIVREFVLAGWTTSELVAAIDRRPDDSTWHHDGAHGVGNVGAWLSFRLDAWRVGGTVRSSPSQLAAAARHRAAAERRALAEQARDTIPPAASPSLATIRAYLAQRPTRRNP